MIRIVHIHKHPIPIEMPMSCISSFIYIQHIFLDKFLLMWFSNSTFFLHLQVPEKSICQQSHPQVFRMPRDVGKPRPPATAPHGSCRCYGWVWVGEPMGGLWQCYTVHICTYIKDGHTWSLIYTEYFCLECLFTTPTTMYCIGTLDMICTFVPKYEYCSFDLWFLSSSLQQWFLFRLWSPALEEIWGWNTLKHDPLFKTHRSTTPRRSLFFV